MLFPAQPPQAPGAPLTPLPLDTTLECDVVLDFPEKKHKFGVPRVFLRLTWVPQDVDAPWEGARGNTPLVPWRHTDLTPLTAHVAPHHAFAVVGAVAAAATPFAEHPDSHPQTEASSSSCSVPGKLPEGPVAGATSTARPQSAPRRGNLVVEIVEVDGTIETRYPKYVTVRCNRNDAGKTNPSMDSCEYNHVLEELSNISIDDVLVVRCFRLLNAWPYPVLSERVFSQSYPVLLC